MKKIIALLCVVAMMVSLSSCGGPVEETSSVVTVESGGQTSSRVL